MPMSASSIIVAAALCGSASLASAQTPMAEQMTEDPVVTADQANYWASLTSGGTASGEGAEGAAWFVLDLPSESLSWTIEYSGMTAGDAWISCGSADEVAMSPGEDGAVPHARGEADIDFDLVGDEMFASPIEGGAADLEEQFVAQISVGECFVVIASDGEAEAPNGQIFGVIEPAGE